MDKVNFHTRLKGTTIVEALIAMVVIAISFGIGMQTVDRVWNTRRIAMEYRVSSTLENLVGKMKREKAFENGSFPFDDFRVDVSVSAYSNFSGVLHLDLVAVDLDENVISEIQELIYAP